MQSKRTLLIACLVVVVSFALADSAHSQQNKSIEDFLGVYVGRANTEGSDEVRDLDVFIEANKRGFNVNWSAVIRAGEKRAVPGVKRRAIRQAFQESRKQGFFGAGRCRYGVLGTKKLGIVGGDPVIWARPRKTPFPSTLWLSRKTDHISCRSTTAY